MAGRISLESFDERNEAADGQGAEAPCPTEPEPSHMPEPEPEVDREAERNAALTRLAAALETIAAEQAALRAGCLRQAAEALGRAAGTVLPALARTGFCALVAETAKTVAQNGRWPELVVSVAEDQAAEIAGYLEGPGLAPNLRIEARPGMLPGEAEIAWDGGGAEIDAATVAETAIAGFRRELDALSQTGA